MMNKPTTDEILAPEPEALFGRIVSILERARGNVVRSVNTNMVLAYWLIGREIVQELQGGEERAEYGRKVIEDLSSRLTERYGKGFSEQSLQNFRRFYLAYSDRVAIPSPAGRESLQGFSPQLSWSHYRALMRVDNIEARDFYERETISGGWDKRTLERQIQSFYYERILKSRKPEKMLAEGRGLSVPTVAAADELKNPYVLEFLGLPDLAAFHESDLERAVITHLQRFLLELGNGFAFVARQKHIRIEEQDRYIDLVFYNCRLKFYLLIELKVGELTHADVGQMDGYVRMFDDLFTAPDDNPTIGLILCSEKNQTIARYSVLKESRQLFAKKYRLQLPSEDELAAELKREILAIREGNTR